MNRKMAWLLPLLAAALVAGCTNPYTEESGELEDEQNNAANEGAGAQPGAGQSDCPNNLEPADPDVSADSPGADQGCEIGDPVQY